MFKALTFSSLLISGLWIINSTASANITFLGCITRSEHHLKDCRKLCKDNHFSRCELRTNEICLQNGAYMCFGLDKKSK